MIDFIMGLFVGIFGLSVVALHFANKAAKPEAKPQHNGISAVGLDPSGGNSAGLDAYHARMLESIMRHYEGQA
jgi:hypothetical protein